MNNMQEYHHYNSTPDQGWTKMKPVLDEAMPVGRRQKRFSFIWWSTSTLLICGVIGLGFFKGTSALMNPPSKNELKIQPSVNSSSQNNIKKNTVLPAAEIQSNQKTIETSINNVEQVSPKVYPTLIQGSEATPQERASSKLPPVAKPSKKEKSVPMALIDNTDEEEVDAPIEIQALPIVYTGNDPDDNKAVISDEGFIVSPTNSLRNGQVVESLPGLSEIAFLTTDMSDASVPTIVIDKSKRQPSFLEPNIAVSGLIGQDGGMGYYGGAGLHLNVSRRFSFTTSIGYMSFRPEASLFGGAKSLDATPEYNTIIQYDPIYTGNETYLNSEYINSSTGYNVIIPFVEKVNQWQLDLGLKWKWSGRFYTDAGVKLGFQTKAFSEYPIISQDDVGTSFPRVSFDNSLNSYNVIRSNTTSVYAGVGYRFGQHMEVFTNWTLAFDEYLLNEDRSATADLDAGSRTDYIRGLSVGLRYTL